MRNRRNNGSGGFTLIEMMVVVAIIVMAAAFMVPTLAKFMRNRNLQAAGSLIVGTLNEARSAAVSKRKEFAVVFLQEGLYLYDVEMKKFEGQMRKFSRDGNVSYRLMFLGEDSKNFDINDELTSKEEGLLPDDIAITFDSTGTIDFGRFADIGSERFNKGDAADIVLDQMTPDGRVIEDLKGLVDIRPAGAVAFKIQDFAEETE